MASPVMFRLPVVELTTAPRVTVPALAFSTTSPEPFAVTTELVVRSPALTAIWMAPFPPSVCTPVPERMRPMASVMTMSLEAEFDATKSSTLVLRATPSNVPASPELEPIPSDALAISRLVVTVTAAPAALVMDPRSPSLTPAPSLSAMRATV